MVTHRRTEIRAKAYELLNAALADTPVTVAQDVSHQPESLPEVSLYTLNEQATETLDLNPPGQTFTVELVVNAIVGIKRGPSEALDQLDALCLVVENALGGTLGGIADSCLLQSTTIEPLTLGNKDIYGAVLIYNVNYTYTVQPPAPADLADLDTIHIQWDMAEPSLPGGGPDEQIDAEDTLTL